MRNQARKPIHIVSKPDTSVDESFEDLLSKYKQIQLELECIRKEETMALEPQVSPDRVQAPVDPASVQESRPVEETGPVMEEQTALEPAAEKKVFQAFNIKPLRQKLPTTVNLEELRRMSADQENGGEAETQGEQDLLPCSPHLAFKCCVLFMFFQLNCALAELFSLVKV